MARIMAKQPSGELKLQELVDEVRTVVTRFDAWLKENGPSIMDLLVAFQRIPERSRVAMLTMAQHGWYLHSAMSLSDIVGIAERLGRSESAEVESEMCDDIDSALDDITDGILAEYGQRAEPIRAAIEAHRRGDYYLSTPVLLAQADGLTRDQLGQQLYARKNGVPAIERLYRDLTDDQRAFFAPLLEKTPMTATELERQGRAIVLNRHAILHGETCDYGTRGVSCRAVAFLSFVAWSLAGGLATSDIDSSA